MALLSRADRKNPLEKTNTLYRDFFSSFSIGNNNDLEVIENEFSVRQSIVNIIQTRTGERPFSPNYGSEVHKLLFENFSTHTSAVLSDLIRNAIENFEPRANVMDVIVTPREENNAYTISIIFSVINKVEPIALEFLINRTR